MPPPYQAVYFDCDSTLSSIEGIDELTETLQPDARAELVRLTSGAMEGRVPLAEVYEARLAAIAPTREQVEALGRRYVERVQPGAVETVRMLADLGKEVGIVSGGLRPAVLVLAVHLGIPAGCVHAVGIEFDARGAYAGFDRESPLRRNGGKAEVLRGITARIAPIVFIGDGITDLEAAPCVDLFIGYGGVIERPEVRAAARAYVVAADLTALLELCLTPEERTR